MLISCIIPCLNERYELPAVLRLLGMAATRCSASVELIVVDGGSSDGSGEVAAAWTGVSLLHCRPLRAAQMNTGAAAARGEVLYFVHADTRPPLSCFADIEAAVAAGRPLGGYPFCFDSASQVLRFNSWMTNFNVIFTRGGDQSIYVTRELYAAVGGFRESMTVMEEYSFLRDLDARGVKYHLLGGGRTLVSARKYDGRSWVRVQVANICAMTMWRLNRPADDIRRTYGRVLRWPKGDSGDKTETISRTYGREEV